MPSAASPEDPLQDLLDLYGGAGSFPGTQATHGFTVLTSTPYLDAPLPILPPPPPESPCAPSPVVQQVSEPGSSAPRSRRGRQEVDEANIIHTTHTILKALTAGSRPSDPLTAVDGRRRRR
ncbi:hypothetical protein B0H10DRAFT_2242639 [Mycena sp. CBHHK59/15]|nr:hypothetical protein B0H10DRAFT_2242639 [Mycena sp. CBHHK59/15]